MTWLWVILIVAAIGGLIRYFGSHHDKVKNAVEGALIGGMGCGCIILQIFLTIVGLWILFKVGSWLFS